MKKTLLIVAGALALLIGGIGVVGATMDRDHEDTRAVVLLASPEAIFAKLVAVEEYPTWRRGVDKVEVLGHDPLRFVEHGEDGELPMGVERSSAPELLVVRIDDTDLPFGGTWTYRLEPEAEGTRLTITERGYVDNVFVRFFAHMFIDPAEAKTRYLEDLGAAFGQDVTPG